MSLIKFGSNVANTANTNPLIRPALPAAPAPTAPMPPPVAATTTNAASPEIAALLARLQAAESAVAAEKARADAAEKARAAGGGRGYSMKASEKGAISIYGVSTKFPVTLYAPHLVGIIRDLVMSGKATAFLRENAGKLSVKVDGTGQAGTGASETAVRALADELDRVITRK
jgi:hypothetical protein